MERLYSPMPVGHTARERGYPIGIRRVFFERGVPRNVFTLRETFHEERLYLGLGYACGAGGALRGAAPHRG